MRPLLARYGPHAGLFLARMATLVLFVLAGVTVAGAYLEALLAVLVGGGVGVGLGLVADLAAVAYGRRVGRQEIQDHAARQQADRAARNAGPGGGARHDAPRAGTPAAGRPRPGPSVAATAAGARTPVARHAAAIAGGSRLVDGQGELDVQRDALVLLRQLVNDTLQPYELIGQQGRGVIQLAHELAPMVPMLDAETVVAYVGDHVLIAAGSEADQPGRWPGGLLSGVNRLRMPAGVPPLDAVVLERVDGLDKAAGEDLPGKLDTIVRVIANSGRADGLSLSQITVCLEAAGYRVGSYTLAAACRRLIQLGRLERPAGEVRYRLTGAERGAGEGPRPPLDVVFSVLRGGPARGMTTNLVTLELNRRREVESSQRSVVSALVALVEDGRVRRRTDRGEQLWQVADPSPAQILAGPGLRQHVLDILTDAEMVSGLEFDGILSVVRDVPGFADTTVLDLQAALATLAGAGRVRQPDKAGGLYRLA